MRVIALSGGRSSGMMLKILIDNGLQPTDQIIFTNTGKERPETLDFIKEIGERWGVPIVWLEFIPEKPLFKIVNHETASRDGRPFADLIKKRNYLPNATQRFCTGELKVKTARRFVRSLKHRGKFENLLGLRFDEPTRIAKKKEQNAQGKEPEINVMPLHEMRITKEQVANFWANQPFDLQIPSRLGNCDLCFMKGENNIIWTIRESPELSDWWIEIEKHAAKSAKRKRNGQFNKKWSYATLKHIAQTQTYIPLPIDEGATVNCRCTD